MSSEHLQAASARIDKALKRLEEHLCEGRAGVVDSTVANLRSENERLRLSNQEAHSRLDAAIDRLKAIVEA